MQMIDWVKRVTLGLTSIVGKGGTSSVSFDTISTASTSERV